MFTLKLYFVSICIVLFIYAKNYENINTKNFLLLQAKIHKRTKQYMKLLFFLFRKM